MIEVFGFGWRHVRRRGWSSTERVATERGLKSICSLVDTTVDTSCLYTEYLLYDIITSVQT